MPINTTSVVPLRESAAQSSRPAGSSGARWPDTTVKPAGPSTPVSATPASTGAAIALVMPGTTSTGTPAAVHDSSSCAPCASTYGSPPLSRTTVLPARARAIISVTISS